MSNEPPASAVVSPSECARAAALIDQYFGRDGNELLIGGLIASDLAARYGTPLYIYDERTIARQWQALRQAYPKPFQIFYSVKANPNQALLRLLLDRACGLEIASAGELFQATEAGCSASQLLFAGPGKSPSELRTALEIGIGEIHIESLTEARRLADLAQRSGRRVRVALRINPASAVEGGSMRMGGKPTAFGIDEDQLPAVVAKIKELPGLEIVGLHVYLGTQILDHATLLTQYRAAVGIARQLAKLLDRPLETIDFGGGLGIPYFSGEAALDVASLQVGLEELVAEVQCDDALRSSRLIVEPGRFLVGPAGIYLARVVDIKASRGKKFVITDGGMHHHLAASGNLGQTIKRNYPLTVANKLQSADAEKVDVVGPLCTPLDVLGRQVLLPAVEVGDLIAIFQSGAYARAASPLGFLSHPAPPEVLVVDGADKLIRRRGTAEDYLADQVVGDRCLLPV